MSETATEQAAGSNNAASSSSSSSNSSNSSAEASRSPDNGKRLSQQELFERASERPCHVVDVMIGPEQAARRTSPELIERELKRVYEASTLAEVVDALQVALSHLEQLEVFSEVAAELGDANPDDPAAARLRLHAPEVRRFKGSTGTYVQGGEVSLEVRAQGCNLAGIADQWELAGEVGHRSSRNLLAGWRLPRAGGTDYMPFVRVFQLTNNQQLLSSWTEALRGLRAGVNNSNSPVTSLYYEAGWRQLLAGPTACRAVKAAAGDYLRSAAGFTWSLDGRTPGEYLAQGLLVGGLMEVAGLGAGSGPLSLKKRLDASWATNLSPGLALTLNASAGALFPLALTSSSSSSLGPKGALSLPDRFFLGGVENGLRGFAPRGVEPAGARARRPAGDAASGVSSMARTPTAADGGVYDALGADLFANVMAALRVKLPGAPGELGMHLQVFVNGGSAALWGASALARAAGGSSSSEGGATSPAPGAASSSAGGWRGTLAGSARDLLNTFRWTAGAGVVLPTPFGSFELNYCWVLTHQERDRLKQGLQLGFAAGGTVGRHGGV